jgi:RHS repeat-associated protein
LCKSQRSKATARSRTGPLFTDSLNIDESLSELISGTTSYYEHDGLGSVSSLSNSAGALANTYTYDSYGKLTASTGTTANPFQYTGREFDAETGIYYYRARYYDENVGRFIGEDPIRFKAGPNFYEYVKGNPVALKDAYGLQAGCTLVGQHQLTPWIPTATISSQTPWVYKDSSEIDDKGIAVVRCKWERTVTKALWGSALFAFEYRCVEKLPCGLALEYNSYTFEWHRRSEGQQTDPDWTGTSYTIYPLDDGDLFYETLCKLRPPN